MGSACVAFDAYPNIFQAILRLSMSDELNVINVINLLRKT